MPKHFRELSSSPDKEGIIPALETAHAVAYLRMGTFSADDRVVVVVSWSRG